MTIHILPTQRTLDSLCEIEEETGLTISADGELVKPRRPSLLFDMMFGMTKDLAELNRNPFMGLRDE